MEGKPVGNTSGTSAPQASSSGNEASVQKGKFGSYTAKPRANVKPQIPSAPETSFQQLHGMFLPVPSDFFTFFERPLLSSPMDKVMSSVTDFNLRLLGQMGFPNETRDFFNDWALTDAGFATITGEESEALLKEANELLASAPDDAVYEKVSLYKDGRTIDITPADKSTSRAFNKLWDFFERLFTSPFSFLSNKREQAEFRRTLDILEQRVHGVQPRRVSQTEPDASVRPQKQSAPAVSTERKKELEYILNCRKQTPVYYDGELCHFQRRADNKEVILKKTDGSDIQAPVDELYLPPAYKEATRIVNPADVELPGDQAIEPLRESELLYLCAYTEKGDQVLYKGKLCTVIDITPLETSPQIMLKTEDGRNIDAALHHIQLPPDPEELPELPADE